MLGHTSFPNLSFILFPMKKHIGNTMLWEAPKWDHMVLQTGHVRLFQLLESVVHAQAEPQAACCQEPGVGDWFSDGWCIWFFFYTFQSNKCKIYYFHYVTIPRYFNLLCIYFVQKDVFYKKCKAKEHVLVAWNNEEILLPKYGPRMIPKGCWLLET